ncbi:MAG: GTP-binding protein [Polyangiales bacterium]
MSEKKRIPVNLIAGPLGVGKTTMINHLLSQRPQEERWAILVNEYGLVGIDAAMMEAGVARGAAGVEIREVAGGCICCSAAFMFEVSLVRLLQRRPHRLLIEPTGLAALSGILDTLDRPGIREAVELRSIVCALDLRRFDDELRQDVVKDQVEAADVLLGSRPDLASDEQRASFREWAGALFPAKRVIGEVENGLMPLSLLDVVKGRASVAPRGGHRHGTDHSEHPGVDHGHESSHRAHTEAEDTVCDASTPILRRAHHSSVTATIGWVCWCELVFDAEQIALWLRSLARLPGARRTKAVFHTNDGWWSFNFTDGDGDVQPSSYRRDSRVEVVIDMANLPDVDHLEETLRRCVASASSSNT